MVKKTDLINQLKEFLSRISKKVRVSRLIFFGSRARGHPRKYSDVDLIVVSPDFRKKKFGRSRELYDFWDLDLPVDFLCFTPEEYEEKRKSPLNIVGMAERKGINIFS